MAAIPSRTSLVKESSPRRSARLRADSSSFRFLRAWQSGCTAGPCILAASPGWSITTSVKVDATTCSRTSKDPYCVRHRPALWLRNRTGPLKTIGVSDGNSPLPGSLVCLYPCMSSGLRAVWAEELSEGGRSGFLIFKDAEVRNKVKALS